MIAQLARCPDCNAVIGVVFQLGPVATMNNKEIVSWWKDRGFRVEGTYLTEAAYALDMCVCVG